MTLIYAIFFKILILYLWIIAFGYSSSTSLNYAIEEESSPNTFIGNLLRDSTSDINSVIKMHSVDSNVDKCLKLNDKSGKLYSKIKINREEICSKSEIKCQINFVIQINDEKWVKVFVEITDINDNKPMFKRSSYMYNIAENVAVGYLIQLDTAYDWDMGLNGKIRYSILNEIPQFSLVSNRDNTLNLRVNSKLDYEKESMRHIKFDLEGCDRAPIPLCGSTVINVHLIDVNDNSPVFEKKNVDVFIKETVDTNTEILDIKATDKDSNNNGKIKYSLSSNDNTDYTSYFIITNDGKLKVIRSLAELTNNKISLKVTAEDYGNPPLKSNCYVKVVIVDVNNHSPDIISKPTLLSVMENKPTNTKIGLLLVTDKDDGENGQVTCRVVQQNDLVGLRKKSKLIKTDFYELYTKREFDREKISNVILAVSCTDRSSTNPLRRDVNITIKIIDENEYPPTFLNNNLLVNVQEDIGLFANFFQLFADDEDATKSLTFKFEYNYPNFKLNPKTGWLSIRKQLDREKVDKYRLSCLVSDVNDKFSSKVVLTIRVTDVNDNIPILKPPKTYFVRENVANNPTDIGELFYSDLDLEENGTVSFFLMHVKIARGIRQGLLLTKPIFSVDTKSGKIHSLIKLDREEIEEYILTIKIMDHGQIPLNSTDQIRVRVNDVNDNRPMWNSKLVQEINITFPMDMAQQPIYRLRATDLDSRQNGNISYILVSRSVGLRLNGHTGEVFATEKLIEGIVDAVFQATDNGRPPQFSDRLSVRFRVYADDMLLMGGYNGGASGGLSSRERERLDSMIIIVIASATCIVFLCLLSAIVVVRWQREPTLTSGGGSGSAGSTTAGIRSNTAASSGMTGLLQMQQHDMDGLVGSTNMLDHIKKENNVVGNADTEDPSAATRWILGSNGLADHYPTLAISNKYYRPPSAMSQEIGKPIECYGEDALPCENSGYSVFQFRYPLGQELDISSGDSGKGTIEDDVALCEMRAKAIGTSPQYHHGNRNQYIPLISPFPASQHLAASTFTSNLMTPRSLTNYNNNEMISTNHISETVNSPNTSTFRRWLPLMTTNSQIPSSSSAATETLPRLITDTTSTNQHHFYCDAGDDNNA